ncbi:MAG: calcium-binding protein [Ruegeria sp.]
MFLVGLIGLAAVGGAAYAISDVFFADEDEPDETIEETPENDLSNGNLLEIRDGEAEAEYPENKDMVPGLISEFQGNLVIAGNDGSDTLTGQDGNDQINGYAGDDVIIGAGGNDTLHGGIGDDVLTGGAGSDVLHGDAGADLLDGEAGDDILYGHDGADLMRGGQGDDHLYGGQDDDTLVGEGGDDALQGGDGDDLLIGGDGSDALFGGDGNDTLDDRIEDVDNTSDFLNGGAGDDTIVAGSSDIVTSGSGADEIYLAEADVGVSVMDFQPGEDKLVVTWDDSGGVEPDISIEHDADNEDLTRILVDGREVAHLFGADGISVNDIQLVSQGGMTDIGRVG